MQLHRFPFDVRRADRKRLNIGCVLSAPSLCTQRGRKRTCVPTVLFELLARVTRGVHLLRTLVYVMASCDCGEEQFSWFSLC